MSLFCPALEIPNDSNMVCSLTYFIVVLSHPSHFGRCSDARLHLWSLWCFSVYQVVKALSCAWDTQRGKQTVTFYKNKSISESPKTKQCLRTKGTRSLRSVLHCGLVLSPHILVVILWSLVLNSLPLVSYLNLKRDVYFCHKIANNSKCQRFNISKCQTQTPEHLLARKNPFASVRRAERSDRRSRTWCFTFMRKHVSSQKCGLIVKSSQLRFIRYIRRTVCKKTRAAPLTFIKRCH